MGNCEGNEPLLHRTRLRVSEIENEVPGLETVSKHVHRETVIKMLAILF